MKIDMNRYKRHIVAKDGKYLVCVTENGIMRFSDSYYDAWFTDDIDKAIAVANRIKGTRLTFNSLTGVFQ